MRCRFQRSGHLTLKPERQSSPRATAPSSSTASLRLRLRHVGEDVPLSYSSSPLFPSRTAAQLRCTTYHPIKNLPSAFTHTLSIRSSFDFLQCSPARLGLAGGFETVSRGRSFLRGGWFCLLVPRLGSK